MAATFLWRRRRLGRVLRWLPLALLPIPPYIHALAWNAAVAATGRLLQQLGWPIPAIDPWIASCWVQWMALLPLAVGLALVGLESVDERAVEAAALLKPDGEVWRRIILPLAAPALAAVGGLLFALSLGDYSVPSLFGMSVYALDIFAEFSASGEPARAAALATPLLLLTGGVTLALQGRLRQAAQAPAQRSCVLALRSPLWLRVMQALAVALLLLQATVLLGALFLATQSAARFVSVLASARREIVYTAWLATLAAALALPLALVSASGLARGGRSGLLWWLLVVLPLAVPPPLVGIGLIAFYNRPIGPDLYALGALPVLANLARFAPIAALVVLAQTRRLDPQLLEAARLLQRRPWQAPLEVHLPLLAPGLLAAAALVFSFTAGELGATLIVAPPGSPTLTMRIYNYLHYGASADVAGLCLALALCALFGGGVAAAILSTWNRRFTRGGEP
jgi:iron(III) transport system permease protein